MMNIEQERKEFEAQPHLSKLGESWLMWIASAGMYENKVVQTQFEGWMARAALSQPQGEPKFYFREVHAGWPEFCATDEFSDGEGGGLALFTAPPAQPNTSSKEAALLANAIVQAATHQPDVSLNAENGDMTGYVGIIVEGDYERNTITIKLNAWPKSVKIGGRAMLAVMPAPDKGE